MQGFQAHSGLASFIKRLDMEVNVCRKEQPFEIEPDSDLLPEAGSQQAATSGAEESSASSSSTTPRFEDREDASNPMEFSEDESMSSAKTSDNKPSSAATAAPQQQQQQVQSYPAVKSGKTCLPQRAALLKSMHNFLKKAIQDPTFSDSIRHIMEGTLPSSLKHIISNSEYYGPSLFLLATDVVTVYVFQEPSLLSTLQDNGLTDVVLHALLSKDVSLCKLFVVILGGVYQA